MYNYATLAFDKYIQKVINNDKYIKNFASCLNLRKQI
jgi:hypothetical protein